ncbi:MAG TPA: hypothetical protein VEW46_03785 [Pyrinomonadaceae bacterium]|nr:hypothetical protein [Pyrinomonadaceae bacterium]
MSSAFDYLEMAREYLSAAVAAEDHARKEVLLGIAELFTQTALVMEANQSPLAPAE